MIHSGSRNLGKQVAEHYNKLAKKLNEKWYSKVDEKVDLAFLPLDSEEGKAYIREMEYCVEFALANRKLMMSRISDIFSKYFKNECCPENDIFFEEEFINIAHNYASLENHFGQNVMVHRKGATLARKDTLGIIPGSQGTASYIVKGKGNKDSFESCSHGAGRKMGRKQAIKELDLEAEIKMLDDQGIIHSVRGKQSLDEAPSAYKDINEVMKNQEDLVEILVELKPLAVIKV
jgi:tRNA-splicing ligase RtcB